MKIQLMRWLGLLLLTGMLAACGGGGKGNSTSATMGIVQAQLTVWQNKFATSIPPATDPVLASLFDDTDVRFLHDGANKISYLNNIATSAVWPIGATFSAPVAILPPDVGVVQNDGTHQWFTTQLEGTKLTMLAIQNTPGVWLFAGNQRQIGVDVAPYAQQTNGATPTSGMTLGLKLNGISAGSLNAALSLLGVTTATVSGPGLIGPTLATLGPVTIVSSGSTQPVPECSLSVTINCLNRATVTPGIYTVTILGTKSSVPFNYTYNEAVRVSLPATIGANFPTFININGQLTPTSVQFFVGAPLSVSWLVTNANQIRQYASMSGWSSAVPATQLFYVDLPASSVAHTNSTILPAVFDSASAVGHFSVQVSSTDSITGLSYTTTARNF